MYAIELVEFFTCARCGRYTSGISSRWDSKQLQCHDKKMPHAMLTLSRARAKK
jgi:hypothetical protein